MSPLKQKEEIELMKLDTKVSKRLIALSRKYPQFCADYLEGMHKIIDSAEKKLKDIKSHDQPK